MLHQLSSPPSFLDRAATASGQSTSVLTDLIFNAHSLNRHTANLALLKYFNFQGFLITGQHSGTHWIKWMLSHALAHRYGVEPPYYHNNPSSNVLIGHPRHPRQHANLPRIASSHSIPPYALQWAWLRQLRRPPPYVVVIRDVRDLLISNYEKWKETYQTPFSRYVKGDPRGYAYVCDAWWYVRFANRWGDIARRWPDETVVLRYEDFRSDPLENLRRVARHFQLDLSDADLEAGIVVGSKAHMATRQDPAVDEIPIRADGAGDTRFTTADLGALGAILGKHLKHDFGYAYFEQPRGYQIPGVSRERRLQSPTGWLDMDLSAGRQVA